MIRFFSLLAAAVIVIALFTLGEKPYAGSLFPAPWDKLAHISVYGTIAILVWIGTGGRAFAEGRAHRAGAVALFVLAIGLLDELHQVGIPGRSADVADLVADAIGICVAFYLLRPRKTVLKGNP